MGFSLMAGIRQRHIDLVKIFCSCILHLSRIMRKGRYKLLLRIELTPSELRLMNTFVIVALMPSWDCLFIYWFDFFFFSFFSIICFSNISSTCFCSSLQDGFELPSRLAVSAADCVLVLTESLTKIPAVPSSRQKSSDLSAPNQRVAVVAASGDKKSSEVSNGGIENLLWDQLEEVIHLVHKLLAVS